MPRLIKSNKLEHISLEYAEVEMVWFLCFLQHALTVEGARITYPDKMASNGIIHRIEKVLMPPVGTIVDVLTKDGSFNTLLVAANAAGLVEALKGKAYDK